MSKEVDEEFAKMTEEYMLERRAKKEKQAKDLAKRSTNNDAAIKKHKAFEKAMKEIDNVNHPKHYADSCSVECIDAMIMAYGKCVVHNFCICNAFKYLWRHKNKNGMEDLNKAEWYINKAEELSQCPDATVDSMRGMIEKYREKFESSSE